ncbi:hypothetical protein PIB30_019304 [Stylosanthes scabra]|uniref:NAC domain-containing protein n=1 Tax=Stylosanthes scabra TaxID=79078 RepID=A0ABU6V760_9FABA|nr:hypothetical protein [Stylosanthes scabra]
MVDRGDSREAAAQMSMASREAHMSIAASSMFPGFRFCPTDEELISYYLRKKLDGDEDSVQVISELELCTFEPWDLPGKSFIQSENEWFFFSPRGRKYPNGSQSKRATECGYWKATGKERNVKSGQNVIGTKRTLVFHLGRAPKGERTEWIMHEYCINDKSQDSLVVCRLKRNTEFRMSDHSNRASSSQINNVNSHESDCGVSEGVTDQGGTSLHLQDKEAGCACSSKRSSSSNSSPSTTGQMDSVTESNPKVDEEDCYAEILKHDIIKLDESALSRVAMATATTTPSPPRQGTANRRIRLRVPKSRVSVSPTLPAGIRFQCSKQSSRRNTIFVPNRLLLFTFSVFTLLALSFFLIGRSQTTTAQYSGELGS